MKTVEELTTFYYNELYPTLEKFEERRKKLKFKIIFLFIIILWNTMTIYFFFFFGKENSFDVFPFFMVGLFFIGKFLYKYVRRDYREEFKQEIIRPLIKELDSNLNYSSSLSISKNIFNKSELFTKPDLYSGNDFILGQIDSTKIQFSDVHAQKKYQDSKGKTRYSTIFQGLFIVADFNKNFYGKTVILPDIAQNTFGSLLGSWLQSKNISREELVKMDNIEFEQNFVIYSTDQVEARYILTHSFMERILNYKKKIKHNLYISFVENSIHVAIDYKKDLFEPTMFTTLLNDNITKEYIETLVLAINIVNELKLNERLWSRQ